MVSYQSKMKKRIFMVLLARLAPNKSESSMLQIHAADHSRLQQEYDNNLTATKDAQDGMHIMFIFRGTHLQQSHPSTRRKKKTWHKQCTHESCRHLTRMRWPKCSLGSSAGARLSMGSSWKYNFRHVKGHLVSETGNAQSGKSVACSISSFLCHQKHFIFSPHHIYIIQFFLFYL